MAEFANNFPSDVIFARIQSCVDNPEALLNQLRLFFIHFQPRNGSSSLQLLQRRRLFDMGAFSFCLGLLHAYPDHEEVCAWVWCILRDAICVFDNDNGDEFVSVDLALSSHILPEIVMELNRSPARFSVLGNVFSALTTICLVSRHAMHVCRSGVVEACLEICHQDLSEDFSTSALGSLKNLAMERETISFLIETGCVEAAQRFTSSLASTRNGTLKLGLCACSLIVRLVGGEGWDLDLFYDKLFWLLTNVLNAGPRGTIINNGWNPANVVLDIDLLSQCDENKPKMKMFVKLVPLVLKERGMGNTRLVTFSLRALFQLYCEDEVCRWEFFAEDVRGVLLEELGKVTRHQFDASTVQIASAMKLEMEAYLSDETVERKIEPVPSWGAKRMDSI